ncbi:hypothetical protein [Schumannella luteola]
MTRPLAWIAAAGILVAAGAVVLLEPGEQLAQGPIVVAVAPGEEGAGRNIVATFGDVRVGEVLELDSTGAKYTTEGVWVAVDVVAESVVSPTGLRSTLEIDGNEYLGSERLDTDGIESWTLAAGLPTAGTVVFEIPPKLVGGTAHVRLAGSGTPRLDSVIELTVDLSTLEVAPTVTAFAAGRVDP